MIICNSFPINRFIVSESSESKYEDAVTNSGNVKQNTAEMEHDHPFHFENKAIVSTVEETYQTVQILNVPSSLNVK